MAKTGQQDTRVYTIAGRNGTGNKVFFFPDDDFRLRKLKAVVDSTKKAKLAVVKHRQWGLGIEVIASQEDDEPRRSDMEKILKCELFISQEDKPMICTRLQL